MQKGLTLLELVIIIFLLVALGGAGWFYLDPLEIKARENDALRLVDVAILTQAINKSVEVNISSPSAVLCLNKPPCQSQSKDNGQDNRKSNGLGWVKVDLTSQKSVTIPTLPIDPLNNDLYHYSFSSDGKGWEINTSLESKKYHLMLESDGGDDPEKYEVGTNLTLQNK